MFTFAIAFGCRWYGWLCLATAGLLLHLVFKFAYILSELLYSLVFTAVTLPLPRTTAPFLDPGSQSVAPGLVTLNFYASAWEMGREYDYLLSIHLCMRAFVSLSVCLSVRDISRYPTVCIGGLSPNFC